MSSRAKEAANLVDAIVRFCRFLNLSGVRVHPDASHAALIALREIEITNREDFRAALRMSTVHRPEEFALFDHLFDLFWQTGSPAEDLGEPMPACGNPPADAKQAGSAGPGASGDDGAGTGEATQPAVQTMDGESDLDSDLSADRATASSSGSVVLESLVPGAARTEVAEFDRLARSLAPALATRRSRRWMRDSFGPSIDLRGALRGSLRFGGVPVVLPRRRRRLTRTRLVIFCDVSRSMDEHAAFFLRFSAAVLRRLWRVEVFLFATDIVRVTPIWLREAWPSLKLRVPDCGGGTQIGSCLARFLHDYEGALLSGETVVMIFSDGLDAGDPVLLERALEGIQRRCRSIVWLNPLMHLPGYEPTARGMSIALRYIAIFSPAHDIVSLWQLLEHLRSAGLRSRAITGLSEHGESGPAMSRGVVGSDVRGRYA